jgi:hypothetical protein
MNKKTILSLLMLAPLSSYAEGDNMNLNRRFFTNQEAQTTENARQPQAQLVPVAVPAAAVPALNAVVVEARTARRLNARAAEEDQAQLVPVVAPAAAVPALNAVVVEVLAALDPRDLAVFADINLTTLNAFLAALDALDAAVRTAVDAVPVVGEARTVRAAFAAHDVRARAARAVDAALAAVPSLNAVVVEVLAALDPRDLAAVPVVGEARTARARAALEDVRAAFAAHDVRAGAGAAAAARAAAALDALDVDAARAGAAARDRDRAAHDALRAADTYANLEPINRLHACEAHFTNLMNGGRGWGERVPVLNFLTIMTEYYNTYTEHRGNFTETERQNLLFLQGPAEWDVEEVVMHNITCRLGPNIETLRGLMDAFFVVMTPPLDDGALQMNLAEGYNRYNNNLNFQERLNDYFGLDGNDFPNNAEKRNIMTRLLYTKEILDNMNEPRLGLLLGRIQQPLQAGDRNFCSFDGFPSQDLAQRLESKDAYMNRLINFANNTGVAPAVVPVVAPIDLVVNNAGGPVVQVEEKAQARVDDRRITRSAHRAGAALFDGQI